MNKWELPLSVNINGKEYPISNECDYRVVRDIFEMDNDDTIPQEYKAFCALIMFYEDINDISDITKEDFDVEIALREMRNIIDENDESEKSEENGENILHLVDWKQDFELIVPAVNRVLGYDVRTTTRRTHWWTFLAAYKEMPRDSTFVYVVNIRKKKMKGKKLDKSEQEYYNENRKIIDLKNTLSPEEEEWLFNG